MKFDTSDFDVRMRLPFLFVMGVGLLLFAAHLLTKIWTSESSLISLKGTLKYCDTYVTPVTSRGRWGYISESNKAELVFYLHEHKKKFSLVENIEQELRNKDHEEIKRKLGYSDSVMVWIKGSEKDHRDPQIFKIQTNRGNVLEFEKVRLTERPLAFFIILMGLGCILLPIYAFYPRLFGKSV